MKTRLWISAVLALGLASCTKSETAAPAKEASPASPARAAQTPKEQEAHAPTGVVPGSHEDWCEEHGVPESQCTRCDASLIAAFKATGDWCDEHGVPHSQCLKCNPDLKIVRPPKKPEL
ncbi:MAG: hypothetical protein IT384_09500 [Deltaproteobacteria bacterium]|nr:hypothetical protein [Deltaproteobacteria bacterium]